MTAQTDLAPCSQTAVRQSLQVATPAIQCPKQKKTHNFSYWHTASKSAHISIMDQPSSQV